MLNPNKIRIAGIVMILIAAFVIAYNVRPKPEVNIPPDLAVDFSNDISRGTIMGDGTYLLYSLGEDINPSLLNLPAETKTRYVEFEATTKDGKIVYVQYFLLGRITNQDALNSIFTGYDKERGLVLEYLPVYFHSELTRLVVQHYFREFDATTKKARIEIETTLAIGIEPVFKDLGYESTISTILIRQP